MSRIDAVYWNRGIHAVPFVTGASTVMNCSDLLEALANLDVPIPMESLLDVGCGTGRLARHAIHYVGLDISVDAIKYCDRNKLETYIISGPDDIPDYIGFEWVCCMSVFTHIGADERERYLQAFHRIVKNVVVDVIPGDGYGDVALWTTELDDFNTDLENAQWEIVSTFERTSPDQVKHLYYRLRAK